MTPLFSLFERIPLQLVGGIAWLASAAALAALLAGQAGFAQIAMALSLFIGALSYVCFSQKARAQSQALQKITAVCTKVAHGDLEARITHVTETGALADVQWRVNDVIDRCDAFLREAKASLDCVCQGLYYRRILEGGLQGAFLGAARAINESVESQGKAVEKARQEAAAQHAHLISLLADALRNLADGNLTYRLHEFPEAYRQIKDHYNSAMEQIDAALQSVRSGTDAMAAGTREIASASEDLARRTELQAASLEETNAAMEQLLETINQAAQSTSQTKDIISEAKQDSEASAKVVRQTIDAIEKIRGSSQQINGIIGVINEIALQTNLLALNAGVEAARAGEAGRGFAVVATEVRALASRSANAAKEISRIISQSAREVDVGVELAGETGRALDRIMNQFAEIENGIAEIAARSLDRVATMKEVNIALGEIDQTTQQNAAMAEEATAACRELAEEGARLAKRVGQFKVGTSEWGREDRSLEIAA